MVQCMYIWVLTSHSVYCIADSCRLTTQSVTERIQYCNFHTYFVCTLLKSYKHLYQQYITLDSRVVLFTISFLIIQCFFIFESTVLFAHIYLVFQNRFSFHSFVSLIHVDNYIHIYQQFIETCIMWSVHNMLALQCSVVPILIFNNILILNNYQ